MNSFLEGKMSPEDNRSDSEFLTVVGAKTAEDEEAEGLSKGNRSRQSEEAGGGWRERS